ncbi:arginine decarboxylase [Fusobacterium perfoetens]|uniref:arginine decarboxylase n=1 Tax=Fusobacterium perfoetens TaxID=852 RepID=UPI001F45CDA2|nr:arginine decarboxylase [Fusobacterium perfoetens]MCF2626080.1 arginine decarboxylase [Fusobacterium perfoetens]
MKNLEGEMYQILLVHNIKTDEESSIKGVLENLKQEIIKRGVEIVTADSLEDAENVIKVDKNIDCLLVDWDSKHGVKGQEEKLERFIKNLHTRQENVPVFLLAENEKAVDSLKAETFRDISEYVWILEDSPVFTMERISAAIERYRKQLLPPLAKAVMNYEKKAEYSWAAPGHQGGVGFTKTAVGKKFYDFYGENLFRTDMGIERAELGSLLDHTGYFRDAEEYAAKVFGSDRTYSVLGGTSGSNRTIMQACIKDNDIVIADRNCHKSIEQGLILGGGLPVYMTPTRNRYGIIGPILPEQMEENTIKDKIKNNPLIKSRGKENDKGVYTVVTNCTYDGVTYNAEKVEKLLEKSSDIIHFDEAWYGYARFNDVYKNHYAMRGEPKKDNNGPTIFATHSTHKLLNALSQGSFIHVRYGKKPMDEGRFNQAYMMHATTSPLYAIAVSNDIATAMMDGESGKSLMSEVVEEAVEFRKVMGKLYNHYQEEKDWFFKPWNAETYHDAKSGKTVPFFEADTKVLAKNQNFWIMHPEDTWHGFKNLQEDWCMLDPIKVSILTPGMGDDGKLLEKGVPASLVSAYLNRFGIVPTRTTDFQLMFLFSMGVTKGKWGTLVSVLSEFKKYYDRNAPLAEVLPELFEQYKDIYKNMGVKDLGDKMFAYLRANNPGEVLNEAYSTLPEPVITPREAYNKIVSNEVELVPAEKLVGRIAANSVIPYPPGIPMLISGENFGDENSPQIKYLKALSLWDHAFPGFEHDTEGTEVIDGVYHVLCVK